MNIFEQFLIFVILVFLLLLNLTTIGFSLMNAHDILMNTIGYQYDDRLSFIIITMCVNGIFIILTPQTYLYRREHEPVMRVEYPLRYVAPLHDSSESYFFKGGGHMYTRLSDGLYLVTNDFAGNFILKKVRESK